MILKAKDIFEVWEFPEIESLEKLLEILKLDYTKEKRDGTILKNYWGNFFEERLEISTYSLKKINGEVEEISYIPAIAHYEEYSEESNAQKPVFFFKYNTKIYCILFGTSSSLRKIKSNLMGMTNPKNSLFLQWKKVKIVNDSDFYFSSDFFKWLYTKNRKSIETKYGEIKIESIGKIKNLTKLDEDIVNEIEGIEITDDLVTKICLADLKIIESLGIFIKHEKFEFLINFSSNGNGRLYQNKSELITETEGKFWVTEKDYHKVAMLITILLMQGLKESYRNEVSANIWNPNRVNDLARQEGIDVIKRLIEKHSLSNEIKEYLDC